MAPRTIPEGYHSVMPHLIVKDGKGAIEYYKKAFDARERMCMTDPGGRVMHAELEIGDSAIMLADEFPEYHNVSPESLGGSPVVIHLYVKDVDAVAERAVDAGAEIVFPIEDQFYGDRSGRVKDPFGHMWILSTHKEDLSADEIKERAAAMFGA